MKKYASITAPSIVNYCAVRSKYDVIRIILGICKLLNQNKFSIYEVPVEPVEGKIGIYLVVDKMSRIFIREPNKMHAFSFPFTLCMNDERRQCAITYNGVEIDSALVSILLRVFNDADRNTDLRSILEKIWDNDECEVEWTLKIIEEIVAYLMTVESGYIRFDHDEERANDRNHPIDHFDVNYEGKVTYKIGLKETIEIESFIEFLNINDKCWFVDR